MNEQNLKKAADILGRSRRVVVATGAGMSRESGIPTFRDAPNALWEKYDPQLLASREGFAHDPELVWRWYADRREMISLSSPHQGHFAVAAMESMFEEYLLITQNIDNLHRQAGSTRLIELHGNIFRYKCFDRNHPVESPPTTEEVPPRCGCGSLLRPDVVWYGEMLDPVNLDRSFAALTSCEVIVVVGTSGLVYPAAGFPSTARSHGAIVIEINPEATPITDEADLFVPATAGEALPTIVRMLEG